MTNPDLLPPEILDMLTEAFGMPTTDVQPTFGGFSNLTVSATIGAQRCVIKAATRPIKREDVRREAVVLAALAASMVPIAPLVKLIDAESWTIAVTAALPGVNGLHVLEHDTAALPNLYRALGVALAAVHRVQLAARPEFALTDRVRAVAHEISQFALDPPLDQALRSSLSDAVWQGQPARLVHGDIGLHNMLWDGATLALLDWEWASHGTPLLDLAWLRWTLRWRNLPESLWAAFSETYQINGPTTALDQATLRTLMLGQIAMILVRVRGQPAFAEWLRRAEWTLAG